MSIIICEKDFDWLINFEIGIVRNYKFLHKITQFCTELPSNCTALDQSESSNFFHVYDY